MSLKEFGFAIFWGAVGGLATDKLMTMWRYRQMKKHATVAFELIDGGIGVEGRKKPKPLFYKDENGKVMEHRNDDEALLLNLERIYEMIKDEETYAALKTLHDKDYNADEIYQASLYIDIMESGDSD